MSRTTLLVSETDGWPFIQNFYSWLEHTLQAGLKRRLPGTAIFFCRGLDCDVISICVYTDMEGEVGLRNRGIFCGGVLKAFCSLVDGLGAM